MKKEVEGGVGGDGFSSLVQAWQASDGNGNARPEADQPSRWPKIQTKKNASDARPFRSFGKPSEKLQHPEFQAQFDRTGSVLAGRLETRVSRSTLVIGFSLMGRIFRVNGQSAHLGAAT